MKDGRDKNRSVGSEHLLAITSSFFFSFVESPILLFIFLLPCMKFLLLFLLFDASMCFLLLFFFLFVKSVFNISPCCIFCFLFFSLYIQYDIIQTI